MRINETKRERGEGWKLIKINTAHYNVFSSYCAVFVHFCTIGEGRTWIIDERNNNSNIFNPLKQENRKLLTGAKKSDVYVEKEGASPKKTPSPSCVWTCMLPWWIIMEKSIWLLIFLFLLSCYAWAGKWRRKSEIKQNRNYVFRTWGRYLFKEFSKCVCMYLMNLLLIFPSWFWSFLSEFSWTWVRKTSRSMKLKTHPRHP